uniref:Androgen induced 1 n=1 Tax=Felis catus TaxID=9685 RepID=A0ABI7WU26_FELCA
MALVPCQVLRVAILLSYCSILCNYKAIEMPSHQTYGGSWKFLTFIDLRETEHERARGRERGRHRIGNRLQAPSHQPRARCGARTHGPRDRNLAEVGRLTDCATQAPRKLRFKRNFPGQESGCTIFHFHQQCL